MEHVTSLSIMRFKCCILFLMNSVAAMTLLTDTSHSDCNTRWILSVFVTAVLLLELCTGRCRKSVATVFPPFPFSMISTCVPD